MLVLHLTTFLQELPGDFVEPVLLERLTDDSVHVASAALNLEPVGLWQFICSFSSNLYA